MQDQGVPIGTPLIVIAGHVLTAAVIQECVTAVLKAVFPPNLTEKVSLKFLALEGNDQLEGVPPAEHGRDLDQASDL